MEIAWNPWHGCKKLSEGCANCYVYLSDARYERDNTIVTKTSNFNLPIRKARNGEYKIPPGCNVGTCFTSDFLLDTADEWRGDACENTNIAFWFKQTGARLFKDGKLYRIERKFQHSQARKAEINIL